MWIVGIVIVLGCQIFAGSMISRLQKPLLGIDASLDGSV